MFEFGAEVTLVVMIVGNVVADRSGEESPDAGDEKLDRPSIGSCHTPSCYIPASKWMNWFGSSLAA